MICHAVSQPVAGDVIPGAGGSMLSVASITGVNRAS